MKQFKIGNQYSKTKLIHKYQITEQYNPEITVRKWSDKKRHYVTKLESDIRRGGRMRNEASAFSGSHMALIIPNSA